jgi:hypothetical protein
MEITYDMIVKYLVYNNNTFSNTKGSITYSNMFPDRFKFISNNFYKYGVTIYDNRNNNISFWTSFLTLIDYKFNLSFDKEEINVIGEFKNNLLMSKKKIDPFIIRDKINKEPDEFVLQFIVDVMDINFIIFDFKQNNIYVMYHKKEMNPLKNTFIFAKYDNLWEPILLKTSTLEERIFNYSNNDIKNILTQKDIKLFNNNKELVINTNIDKIIKIEKNKLIKKQLDENIFVKEEIINNPVTQETVPNKYSDLNKTKLTKMKNSELIEIINDLGLEIPQKVLKANLVELILNNIK